MSIRYFVALVMFQVAMSSLSAQAPDIAPVIGEFRSPIVADDDAPTTPNFFVFPDAFTLADKAVDPDGTVTPDNIIWSYAGSSTYELNGTARLSLISPNHDPNNPGIRRLGTVDNDPAQRDNDPRTLTIRNRLLSSRFGSNIEPQGEGVLAQYARLTTLIASDGTTWSMKSFMIYTSKGGADRFAEPVEVAPEAIPSSAAGWRSVNITGSTLSEGASGVCVQTQLATHGIGVWISPFRIFSLVKDNIYRIRINVESTAPLAEGTTPLWDFIIDNNYTNPDGTLVTGSQGKFSLDVLNWDTHGGANSVGQPGSGRRTFDIWWAPLPVSAPDWNDPVNGEFAPKYDAVNDARFIFRVLDVNGAVDGQNDAGTLCLKSFAIDRLDLSDFSVVETAYNVLSPIGELRDPTPGFANSNANLSISHIFPQSTIASNTSQGLTISPARFGRSWLPGLPPREPGSWSLEIMDIVPGDDEIDFGTPSTLTDNWPIPWETNVLYRVSAGIQAPDSLGESNPPDLIGIAMDAPTSELSMMSVLSASSNLLGLPKAAQHTNYTAFFHSGNRTNAAIPQFQTLRPRIQLINFPVYLSGGKTHNNGGITLKYLKVEKVLPVE